MLFEVYNKEGRRMEYTESIECVRDSYKKGNLQSMNSIGWKFKLDGKVISLSKLVETLSLKSKCNSSLSKSKKLIELSTHNDNNVVKTSSESKPKRKVRKIRCKNNDTTYSNMSACAKALGIDPAAISYAMQKGTNEYKGYRFEFVED